MRLYHGSPVVVERPVFGVGSPYNDYGMGFYCTEARELACEWACPEPRDGYVNSYDIDLEGMRVLDLEVEYGTLHWLSVLLANRRFEVTTPLMAQAKALLLEGYAPDLSRADVVVGHRADDSYFSFARAFLDNRISLRQLEAAMRLGNLGRQVVLKSERAFDSLRFVSAERVTGALWHPRRVTRDESARSEYRGMVGAADVRPDDVFVLDLIRGR